MKIKRILFNLDMLFLLGVSAVPVNIWTIYLMLEQIPAWVRSNTLWDFTGSIAYTLAFAFLEILAIFLPILALRLFIPDRWAEEKFFAFGFFYVVEVSTFVLLLQFFDSLFWQKRLLIILFVVALVVLFLLVHFCGLVNRIGRFLGDRLAVLGVFFMVFNLTAVVIVAIRNIF